MKLGLKRTRIPMFQEPSIRFERCRFSIIRHILEHPPLRRRAEYAMVGKMEGVHTFFCHGDLDAHSLYARALHHLLILPQHSFRDCLLLLHQSAT